MARGDQRFPRSLTVYEGDSNKSLRASKAGLLKASSVLLCKFVTTQGKMGMVSSLG